MVGFHRGYGPVAEAATMDKCVKDITRDIHKVIAFIAKETDKKRKDDLEMLYHSCKYFIDTWDGSTDEVRAGRQFARHAYVLWDMMMKQLGGRKIIVVSLGGVTIPDATYYGYWCTVRGLTTAQLTAMEAYVDKMRTLSEVPTPAIAQNDDSDVDDNVIANNGDVGGDANNGSITLANVVDAIDTVESAMEVDSNDRNAIAERDNAINGPDLISFSDSTVTIDEMVSYVAERTRQMLQAEKENEDPPTIETDNTETLTPNAIAGEDDATENGRNVDSAPLEPDIGWKSIQSDGKVARIGSNRTMEDSGLAPPTIDSQALPAPNVFIDLLDDPTNAIDTTVNDGFDAESSGWFDEYAQMPNLAQSTPHQGKISIDLTKAYYCISVTEWPIECRFSDMNFFLRFLRDTLKGPTDTIWLERTVDSYGVDKNTNWPRIRRRNYSRSPGNFPNFQFEKFRENKIIKYIWPAPKSNYCSAPQQAKPKPKRKRMAEIGRQNAIDKSPNPRNLRLHGRRGTRGSNNSSIDPATASPAIENNPVELGMQVLSVQRRLARLESKFKN